MKKQYRLIKYKDSIIQTPTFLIEKRYPFIPFWFLENLYNSKEQAITDFNKIKNMKKHTNFDNEITGSYYKPDRFFEKKFDWGLALGTVVMIAACGVIYLLAF